MHANQTPKKIKQKLAPNQKNPQNQDNLYKIINLSPFSQIFLPFLQSITPCKNQLQYLNSPLSINKDLFLQLLGTQSKQRSPFAIWGVVLENQDNQDGLHYGMEEEIIQESNEEDQLIDEDSDANPQTDENDTRKRKRKSTSQIRLLKQQLDGEMNWTKQKLCHMAQVTGLSQSQVYKWCWDQKKKNDKQRQPLRANKLIRKDVDYRQKIEERLFGNTKLKVEKQVCQEKQTERKINKKLVFR